MAPYGSAATGATALKPKCCPSVLWFCVTSCAISCAPELWPVANTRFKSDAVIGDQVIVHGDDFGHVGVVVPSRARALRVVAHVALVEVGAFGQALNLVDGVARGMKSPTSSGKGFFPS